jgi:hypothetical protein
MVMGYVKKQDQVHPQAMSVFLSKSQPANNESPYSRILTVWRGISWLFFHRKYANVGLILAEYATKTAFSYLPNTDSKIYSNFLKHFGIDVESVGLSNVGGSALDLVFPGISGSMGELLIPHTHATKAVEQLALFHNTEGILTNTLKTLLSKIHVDSVSDIVSSLIGRVKALAIGNHPQINKEHHSAFAKYLIDSGWAAGKSVDLMAMAQNAFKIYGSHWFDVGLSTLNQDRSLYPKQSKGTPDREIIKIWLADAYLLWSTWGSKMTPILDTLGPNAVLDMKNEEAKICLPKQPPPAATSESTKAASKTASHFSNRYNHSLRNHR